MQPPQQRIPPKRLQHARRDALTSDISNQSATHHVHMSPLLLCLKNISSSLCVVPLAHKIRIRTTSKQTPEIPLPFM
jgi:hypothetical protein